MTDVMIADALYQAERRITEGLYYMTTGLHRADIEKTLAQMKFLRETLDIEHGIDRKPYGPDGK